MNRGERPQWVDELLAPTANEWILYDSQTQKLKTMAAHSQKEAIKLAISNGIVPRETQDVVPRTGIDRERIMTEEEFMRFMDSIRA